MANKGTYKKGQVTNPRGGATNIMYVALKKIMHEEHCKKTRRTKAEAVVRKLVNKAIEGDNFAMKEVMDRFMGKPVQTLASDPENPLITTTDPKQIAQAVHAVFQTLQVVEGDDDDPLTIEHQESNDDDSL